MNTSKRLIILTAATACIMTTLAYSTDSTASNTVDKSKSDIDVIQLFERAVSLANERCKELYDSEPFNHDDGQVMQSSNQWVWVATTSHGTMDIQASVIFSNKTDTGTVTIDEIVSKDLYLPPTVK